MRLHFTILLSLVHDVTICTFVTSVFKFKLNFKSMKALLFLMMPPKSKLKRKAEQASQLSIEAQKKQRLSSEPSIAAADETAPSSSAHVEDTVSSAIVAPCVSSRISAQTITTLPSTAGPSFVRETEETGGIGEATEVEESVGGEGALGDGEDTDSGTSAGDTAATSKPSQ